MKDEQARFFGKLAALMEGGVPMLRAFEVAAERVEHGGLHAALERVLKCAYSGQSIAEAIAKEAPVFSPEVIVLLEQGEQMGDLERKARAVADGLKEGIFDTGPAEDPGDVGLLDDLVARAVEAGASDVHLVPIEGGARLLFRVDGDLREESVLTHAEAGVLHVLAKRRAGMNPARARAPQRGSFEDGERLVFASTCPYRAGEGLLLRLKTPTWDLSLHDLGLDDARAGTVRSWIDKGHGLIVVTGPSGSGKTTTHVALLNKLDREKRRVTAIEAVPEVRLEGVGSIRIRPEEGFGFAEALRAHLAQDPDSVHLAEIRTLDDANAAVTAAITGHHLFTTLHARGAPEALAALLDLGVDGAGLAEATRGVIAQRLIPKKDGSGRAPVFEVMRMTPAIREALRAGADAAAIRAEAEREGMVTLLADAMRLAGEDVLDEAEVERILG